MRRLVLLFGLTVLSLSLLTAFTYAETFSAYVESVIDGDTFVLDDGQRIRLFGIDAPELSQCYGEAAKRYLQRLVENRQVILACDGTKSYNREVCSASVSGLDVEKELVSWGLAFDYERYSEGRYAEAEQFAYEHRRGVWSGGLKPWQYRRLPKNSKTSCLQ